MDRERYQLIRRTFLKARELTGAAREAYLEQVGAEDALLRREIEEHLTGQNVAGDFLVPTTRRRSSSTLFDSPAGGPLDQPHQPG
jgi:hypothetical protein